LFSGHTLDRSLYFILIVPKKSIKVSYKYVDKKDIGIPCIGTDVSNSEEKWDFMLII
tara:strand:+ start:42 stop:212 length:171 start_codon:yes stop_codon:yes gene_type:complete